jgi:hypothetical protein
MQSYNYSLTELEDMMPWEREVYLTLLQQDVKEKNDKIRQQSLNQGR